MTQLACAARRRLRWESLGSSCGRPYISQVLLAVLSSRRVTCPPGFLRNQFQTGSRLSQSSRDLCDCRRAARFRLLSQEIDRDAASDLTDAANQLGALGCRDDAAGVEPIDQGGKLQTGVGAGGEG